MAGPGAPASVVSRRPGAQSHWPAGPDAVSNGRPHQQGAPCWAGTWTPADPHATTAWGHYLLRCAAQQYVPASHGCRRRKSPYLDRGGARVGYEDLGAPPHCTLARVWDWARLGLATVPLDGDPVLRTPLSFRPRHGGVARHLSPVAFPCCVVPLCPGRGTRCPSTVYILGPVPCFLLLHCFLSAGNAHPPFDLEEA